MNKIKGSFMDYNSAHAKLCPFTDLQIAQCAHGVCALQSSSLATALIRVCYSNIGDSYHQCIVHRLW